MTSRRAGLALASLLTVSLTVAACSSGAEPQGTKTPEPTKKALQISVGVFGDDAELAAWDEVVKDRNEANPTVRTKLVKWDDAKDVRSALEKDALPDVFMVDRDDLGAVLEAKASQPATEMLDERGVDFGDRFSRDALQAMSVEGELQCMPWSINTEVIYVNTTLVDTDAMRAQDLPVSSRTAWTMRHFAAAAAFAANAETGTAGVRIEPTLDGLVPFILSGGGKVFDDDAEPTSLAFSSDETREALEQTLEVLRDASLTPSDEQLEKSSTLQLFKRGKLGLMAGDRSLVPELRAVKDLSFDILPIPRMAELRTTADVSGLCISADSKYPALAAGLIADMVSDETNAKLIGSGARTPANLAVGSSDSFLARDLQPQRSNVFTATLRGAWSPTLSVDWDGLQQMVAPYLEQMLSEPGVIDLDAITTQIDEASRAFLAPEPEETPAPDASSSASPSADAS